MVHGNEHDKRLPASGRHGGGAGGVRWLLRGRERAGEIAGFSSQAGGAKFRSGMRQHAPVAADATFVVVMPVKRRRSISGPVCALSPTHVTAPREEGG